MALLFRCLRSFQRRSAPTCAVLLTYRDVSWSQTINAVQSILSAIVLRANCAHSDFYRHPGAFSSVVCVSRRTTSGCCVDQSGSLCSLDVSYLLDATHTHSSFANVFFRFRSLFCPCGRRHETVYARPSARNCFQRLPRYAVEGMINARRNPPKHINFRCF